MPVISLVGGVAVGKTEIGRRVSALFPEIQFVEENINKNLFLNEFYSDMKRWGFHSRISMLAMILEQSGKYYSKNGVFLIDRCVNELIVFATKEFEEGNMSIKEFDLYKQLFYAIIDVLPEPDLYIFCDCSAETSFERIKKRGRECEQGVTLSFCQDVQERYRAWRKSLINANVIDINTDFECNYEKLGMIITSINKELG